MPLHRNSSKFREVVGIPALPTPRLALNVVDALRIRANWGGTAMAIHFEDYTSRSRDKVRALGDQVFGQGYFPNPFEIAREANAYMVVCVGDDDRVIGFAYGTVLPKRGLRDFLENRIDEIPEDLEIADLQGVVGVIQTVAVAPEYHGQRIGTKLLTIVHDKIVGLGGDKLIATFKRGPQSTNIGGIMKRLGFEFWTRLETYWRERCDQGEFQCSHRTDRCNCQALFFRKVVY